MRLAIVGTRRFNDYRRLTRFIKQYINIDQVTDIISGGARGADALAERFARDNRISLTIHPADWHRYGRRAGPIRNKLIVANADIIVAFWDGKSRGTASTIRLAKQAGKHDYICRYDSG